MMRYHFGTAVVVAAISVAAAKEALRPPQIEPVERADYNRLHSRERCFQQHPYGIIAAIESRKQLPSLLNALGLFGYGVEIGVFQGLFSKHVLSEWRGRKLFLVDPWESQDPLAYADKANMPQAKMDRNLNLTLESVKGFEGRYEIMRAYSHEAAEVFPDNSLDFVFIDANHGYEGVRTDMLSWWPKLRPGGIMSGHDYLPDGSYTEGEFGVRTAVIAFARPRCIQVYSTSPRDEEWMVPSWYFFKPWAL